ncbi:MAG: DNA-3-methyladenine glycosylase [Solirubrobacteraceae bacterium]|nr:MAG: DNA-3-methyladenine glycosylase [Solirubrobacterales bacterium]
MTLPALLERSVVAVARGLVGWSLDHQGCGGVIVETEAYHDSEPACHAYVGCTARTRTLFLAPGVAYVYRSYGIHALLNVVVEAPGVGAAVLIRALEPLRGIDRMRERRGVYAVERLCAGPGRLTQALGVGLELNDSSLLEGPIALRPPALNTPKPSIVATPRVGITKATELPWRFCALGSRFVSAPRPAGEPAREALAARRGPARAANAAGGSAAAGGGSATTTGGSAAAGGGSASTGGGSATTTGGCAAAGS